MFAATPCPPAAVALTWARLPRAVHTAMRASLHALRRSRRGRWSLRCYAALVALAAVAVAADWSDYSPATRLLPVYVLALFCLVVIGVPIVLYTACLLMPWGSCWSTPGADVVVTTWRWPGQPGDVVWANNLAAYPLGTRRAGPFLDELCADADRRSVTIRARAGNHDLLTKLYEQRGFQIVNDGARPTIVRYPTQCNR